MSRSKASGPDWNILAPYFSIPYRMTAAGRRERTTVLGELSKSSAALRKARKIAEPLGIEIEKEGPGAYWVTHPQFLDQGNDPLEGDHFCSDGQEVLAAVNVYAAELTKE